MTDTTKSQKRPDEGDSPETADEQILQEDALAAEVQEAPDTAEDSEADAEGTDEDVAAEEDAEESDDSADGVPAEGEPELGEMDSADGEAIEDGAEEAVEGAAADEAPKKKRALKAALIIAGIVIVLFGVVLAAFAFDDSKRVQKVPQTTMLDGKINVSGMTAEELDKTVTARVKNGFTTKVVLNAGGEEYTIDLSEVGTLNAQQTVDQAFAPYDVPFYERYWDRITTLFGGVRHTYEITTAIAPDKEKLTAQVEQIAKKVNRDAEDASYKYSNGKLVTVKAKDGLKLDVDATVEAVTEALAEESTHVTAHVNATVKKTKAKKTKSGQAIFVDCNSCMIYLYEDGKVTFKQPCSPGRSGYETPTGDWTLSGKIANPTWTNPGSDWAKNMPETIGPGRSNPMGLRKLAVSCGDGIFIHGTDNIGALGSPDSHGCIRVSNDEIVKLYDMVSEGIPIIIR